MRRLQPQKRRREQKRGKTLDSHTRGVDESHLKRCDREGIYPLSMCGREEKKIVALEI